MLFAVQKQNNRRCGCPAHPPDSRDALARDVYRQQRGDTDCSQQVREGRGRPPDSLLSPLTPLCIHPHTSFARPDPILEESKAASGDDDVYHFISYVPFDNSLYELDGLQEGPINLGPVTDATWLQAAATALQARIERYAASEIRFNLMAVVNNRVEAAQAQLEQLQQERESLVASGQGVGDVDARIADVHAALAAAQEQHNSWRVENARRRHNYIPFIFNFLKVLAEKGKLKPLIDQARAAGAGK